MTEVIYNKCLDCDYFFEPTDLNICECGSYDYEEEK